jgi:hypothetical protein
VEERNTLVVVVVVVVAVVVAVVVGSTDVDRQPNRIETDAPQCGSDCA